MAVARVAVLHADPGPPAASSSALPGSICALALSGGRLAWVFAWDHVRWPEPVLAVADPWITLAAAAAATGRVRLGPMVTPLARRRPVKVH